MNQKKLSPLEESMLKLIKHYMDELEQAVTVLGRQTSPPTLMPRPKRFRMEGLNAPAYFPGFDNKGDTHWHCITYRGKDENLMLQLQIWMKGTEYELLEKCDYKPANVYKLVESMKRAIRWCQDRTEGRRRQAEEILRQQKRYVDVIEAEVALIELGKER